MERDTGLVRVTADLSVPLRELEFRATRASGPGGQHVNRSATRVELWWDVARSASLTEVQRHRLLEQLAHRLDGTGRLRLVSGARRSQARNRDAVVERFTRLVAAALHVAPPRRKTRPTAASVERRLDAKRRRARAKRDRQRPPPDE